MTTIVLGDPGVLTAQPGGTPWPGVEMAWTGPDGSVWDLSSGGGPVTLMGVRGLHLPSVGRWTSTAPGLAGSRYRGHRAKARDVWWAVDLHAEAGMPWVETDAAWWRALSFDDEGVWMVRVGTQERRLRLRLASSDDDMPRDPTRAGDITWAVALEAAQPYWEGAQVSRRFAAATGENRFFGQSGDSGVLIISPGNTLAAAAIANLGDVPAWPVWDLTGPYTTCTVGVGGHNIELPALADGETLRVDTRPDAQTAVDGTGVDRVADLGAVSFGSVPAGGTSPLSITAGGTGEGMSVTVTLTPLYRRAW